MGGMAVPQLVGVNRFIDPCLTRNPLNDVSHLSNTHSMGILFCNKNCSNAILALIKIAFGPNIATDILVNK